MSELTPDIIEAQIAMMKIVAEKEESDLYQEYYVKVQESYRCSLCRRDVAQKYIFPSPSLVKRPRFNERLLHHRDHIWRMEYSPDNHTVFSSFPHTLHVDIEGSLRIFFDGRTNTCRTTLLDDDPLLTFEGKEVQRAPVYRETRDVIYMPTLTAGSFLYRDESDVVQEYICNTGFSFYQDNKLVKVAHTSPEATTRKYTSVTIGDDLTKAYFVRGRLYRYRGEYYMYYWKKIEDGKIVTVTRNVVTRKTVSVSPGRKVYYVVGDVILDMNKNGIRLKFPDDAE